MLGQREPDAGDIAGLEVKEIIGTFSTTYIFDENGICVGRFYKSKRRESGICELCDDVDVW